MSLIRKALKQQGKLSGTVEMDTAYFGGKFKSGLEPHQAFNHRNAQSGI
jgi:hypothetical protein